LKNFKAYGDVTPVTAEEEQELTFGIPDKIDTKESEKSVEVEEAAVENKPDNSTDEANFEIDFNF